MATAEVVQVSDESIEQSLNDQYKETSIVLRQSVALERITDNDTYERVCAKVKEAQANIKAIEAQLEPFRAQRHAALQRIYEIKTRLLAPLEDTKSRGSKLIAVYQVEMENRRKAAEEAERQRQLAEAQKQQEQEAETLFTEGREAEAVALLDTTPTVVPIVAPKDVPKVSGISRAREKYIAEVDDFPALVQAVAKGKVPILALMPDEKWLNKQADAMKTLLKYPGVKVKREIGLSGVRSR